jgi:hypothetical protein
MFDRKCILASIILALGIAISHGGFAQESSPAASPAPSSSQHIVSASIVTIHGKIVKLNKARREVTLEGPEGHRVTLAVMNPYNLDAAKVGAPFLARYYEVVTVRKKKPGENIPSASLKQGIGTATPGGTPGASGQMHLTLLVTVDAIDQANGTVTIKGPDGTAETVKARNPQNLKLLKVGDELVVSVSREIAISLQQESAGGAS